MTQYTVDYFIKKFEAIPESNWITGYFRDSFGRCALGHCLSDSTIDKLTNAGCVDEEDGMPPKNLYKITEKELDTDFKEARELSKLFDEKRPEFASGLIIKINNGDDLRYQQSTPKQRILAALYDIKKMREKEQSAAKEVIREKIVYVSVPESVKEQAKELLMS